MLGQQLLLPGEELVLQRGQHRHRLLPAQLETLCYGEISGLFLDRIKSTHHFDRFPRDLGSGLFRLDDLSSGVRPAPGACDLVCRLLLEKKKTSIAAKYATHAT